MCGLVAVIQGKKNRISDKVAKNIFEQMLFVDELRGFHATGVFTVTKNKDVAHYKRALPATDFLGTKLYNTLMSDLWKIDIMVGHNRHATRGAIGDDELAHPFNFDTLIGVHNGTLTNHRDLTEDHYTSDSEALYAALDVTNAKNVLEKTEGAYALIWFDKEEGVLKVARNKERPLYVLTLKDKDSIILASEYKMAEWILDRNNIKVEKSLEINTGKIFTFDFDEPNKWDTENFKPVEKKPYVYQPKGGRDSGVGYGKDKISLGKEITMVVVNKEQVNNTLTKYTGYVEGYNYPSATCYINQNSLLKNTIINEFDDITGKISAITRGKDLNVELVIEGTKASTYTPKQKKDISVISFIGPKGQPITKKEWEELTKHGCSHCTGNIYDMDSGKLAWEVGDMPICPECVQLNQWESLVPRRH